METRENTYSNRNTGCLKEYSAEENIRRYMKKTAGHGIRYLPEHEYGNIYLEVIDRYLAKSAAGKGR